MTLKSIIILASIVLCMNEKLFSQNYGPFNSTKFPIGRIDKAIIEKRSLSDEIEMLANCDWKNRIGKKIDVFWLQTENGNFFGHSYEYFMDCDNVRLIYWHQDPEGTGPIVDFMVENLEDESDFVVAKKKHLKNKKKYREYLEKSNDDRL